MKILYGINSIGNGHISRARFLLPQLHAAGADVTCLFSGPANDNSPFDFSGLRKAQYKKGLSIDFNNGGVEFLGTSAKLALQAPRLISDIFSLDTRAYDVVITDFEPVTAWAAKLKGTPSIGVANHHSFEYDIPKTSPYSPFMMFMNNIVPVDTPLATHFHHFGQPILPPYKSEMEAGETDPQKILVYLDVENLQDVIAFLGKFSDYEFYIYSSQVNISVNNGNLHLRPLSKTGFREDFQTCAGIITNAGYMTISEALQMGKKLLLKPASGQKEQESNALALSELGYGATMDSLNPYVLKQWLDRDSAVKMSCPDTAQAIVDWVMEGEWADTSTLIHSLWDQVEVDTVDLDGI